MSIPRKASVAILGAFVAFSIVGCGQTGAKQQTLEEERTAISGAKPPADAGKNYLAAHGGDPSAIQAKVNSAGAAFQSRKK